MPSIRFWDNKYERTKYARSTQMENRLTISNWAFLFIRDWYLLIALLFFELTFYQTKKALRGNTRSIGFAYHWLLGFIDEVRHVRFVLSESHLCGNRGYCIARLTNKSDSFSKKQTFVYPMYEICSIAYGGGLIVVSETQNKISFLLNWTLCTWNITNHPQKCELIDRGFPSWQLAAGVSLFRLTSWPSLGLSFILWRRSHLEYFEYNGDIFFVVPPLILVDWSILIVLESRDHAHGNKDLLDSVSCHSTTHRTLAVFSGTA